MPLLQTVRVTDELIKTVKSFVSIRKIEPLSDVCSVQLVFRKHDLDTKMMRDISKLFSEFIEYLEFIIEQNCSGIDATDKRTRKQVIQIVYSRLRETNQCRTMKDLFLKFITVELQ